MRHAEFKQFISGERPEQSPSSSPKSRRMRGCIFLFVLQIILLLVWGALFFVLGVLAQYNQLPALIQEILLKL
jgi:hypothetical protein